jgi:hypothetical protein
LAEALKRRSSCALLLTHGNRPANTPHAPDAAASTASHPTFVTIAKRPLCRDRTAGFLVTSRPGGKGNIFVDEAGQGKSP